MTSRPYLQVSLSTANGDLVSYVGDIDLGTVESEDISGSRSLISLADTGGNTKDVNLAALMSGDRTITIQASKKFSTLADKDAFTQRLDALWQGTKITSSRYYPFTIYNAYSTQAYYDVMVTAFNVSSTEVEEYFDGCSDTAYRTQTTCEAAGKTWYSGLRTAVVVHYTLEMKEGKGIGGTT